MTVKARLLALGVPLIVAVGGAHLAGVEGRRLTPYLDSGNVTTWCYGQTQGTPKARYTEAECDADLVRMWDEYYPSVRPYVEKAPMSVHIAFTSLAVNVGKSGWKNPIFLEPLARGDWAAACDAMTAPWKGKHGISKGFKATVGGKPLKGLENRRAIDARMCKADL